MTFRLERIALSGHAYALVAPGQCNKAPRGRQRDAGACCISCPASFWSGKMSMFSCRSATHFTGRSRIVEMRTRYQDEYEVRPRRTGRCRSLGKGMERG
jgi:hypothetical protein